MQQLLVWHAVVTLSLLGLLTVVVSVQAAVRVVRARLTRLEASPVVELLVEPQPA